MDHLKRTARIVTILGLGFSLMGMALMPSCKDYLKKRVSGERGGKTADGPSSESRTDNEVLEESFRAIQENDWPRFAKVSITDADMVVKRRGYSPFKVEQTFEGAVLKPQLWQEKRESFAAVRAGGQGFIDFKNATYLGPGSMIASESWESLDGARSPARLYSLRLMVNGEEIDTKNLAPLFQLVEFNGTVYLIGLAAPAYRAPAVAADDEEEQGEYEFDDDDDDWEDDMDDYNPSYQPPQEEEEPDYGGYFDD